MLLRRQEGGRIRQALGLEPAVDGLGQVHGRVEVGLAVVVVEAVLGTDGVEPVLTAVSGAFGSLRWSAAFPPV